MVSASTHWRRFVF